MSYVPSIRVVMKYSDLLETIETDNKTSRLYQYHNGDEYEQYIIETYSNGEAHMYKHVDQEG